MPAGRPKFQIDYEAVKKLSMLMCTQEEISSFLGCDVRTLQRDEEFCRVYKIGQDNGRMSLRRKQFKLADKSATMAIFLGKQYLGQKDNFDTPSEDKNGIIDELIGALENARQEVNRDVKSETD